MPTLVLASSACVELLETHSQEDAAVPHSSRLAPHQCPAGALTRQTVPLRRAHTTARSVRLSCTAGWEFIARTNGLQARPVRCDPASVAGRLLAAVPPSCTALEISEALMTPADKVGESRTHSEQHLFEARLLRVLNAALQKFVQTSTNKRHLVIVNIRYVWTPPKQQRLQARDFAACHEILSPTVHNQEGLASCAFNS